MISPCVTEPTEAEFAAMFYVIRKGRPRKNENEKEEFTPLEKIQLDRERVERVNVLREWYANHDNDGISPLDVLPPPTDLMLRSQSGEREGRILDNIIPTPRG